MPSDGAATDGEAAVVLVVDVANVMGSRPDGWWRDRAGAAERLVTSLRPVAGQRLPLGPEGTAVSVAGVVAVLEGKARAASLAVDVTTVVDVRRAPADGDTAVVTAAEEVVAGERVPLVVTADRGLRDRLPDGTLVVGPRALLDVLAGR